MVAYSALLRTSLLAAAVSLGGLFAAPDAAAAPVLVRDGNGGSVFNGNGLTSPQVVSIQVSGSNKSVYAAPFALQYSTTGGSSWIDFLTYCLEPDETLGVSSAATVGDLVASVFGTTEYASAAASLSRLYATFFADSLTSDTKAAAFQVALWELAYDTGSNLSAGAFRLNTTGAIATQANTYLTTANWLPSGNVGVILRVGNQDLVVEIPPSNIPVPEPASLALLGLGLGLLIAARQRRRQA